MYSLRYTTTQPRFYWAGAADILLNQMSISNERLRFLDTMVVSSSGWRGVFAKAEDSFDGEVSRERQDVAAAAAYSIASLLVESGGEGGVVVATDSRPTGPLLAKVVLEVLRGMELPVRFLGVSPTPEVLAYTGAARNVRGFIILTASHNPVGHNGIKFGMGDGRVAGGGTAAAAAELFRECLRDENRFGSAASAREKGQQRGLEEVYASLGKYKAEAEEAYRGKVLETMLRVPLEQQGGSYLGKLEEELLASPLGIVIDFNGSARANSIDKEFLRSLGARVRAIHDAPGEIAHSIVPEGPGLADCKEALEEAYREDPAFRLGYVADNDGDRGNLVFINSRTGEAEELHAQEVFALAMVAELAWNELVSVRSIPLAVVGNGPTSLRVDALARLWGAEVHRAEVGEANVIDRAAELSDRRVIIMGEGSNGGNITPPSQVRDPLSTVGAMIKLARTEAFEGVLGKLGSAPTGDRNLLSLVRSLPAYHTTGAYEERAILRISSQDHGKLKAAYEEIFPEAFEERKGWLSDNWAIESYRIVNYEGTREFPGPGNRSGDERGGFKVELLGDQGKPIGFVWMRGSKTEPAFRIMADLATSRREDEEALLAWHTALVRRADERASR